MYIIYIYAYIYIYYTYTVCTSRFFPLNLIEVPAITKTLIF